MLILLSWLQQTTSVYVFLLFVPMFKSIRRHCPTGIKLSVFTHSEELPRWRRVCVADATVCATVAAM